MKFKRQVVAMRRFGALFPAFTVGLFSATVCAAESGDSLPQLDVTYFPGQLFWLAVCFGLLYLLMAFVALPAVQRTQDKRKETIAADLQAARLANDQARSIIADVDTSLANARIKARATLDAMKLETSNHAAETLATQQRELTRQLHDAEARIVTARVAALKAIEAKAQDISTAIVERVTGMAS
jgi:F-type H+-transporting ATPase subunit b